MMSQITEEINILKRQLNDLLPMGEKDQRRLDEKFRLEFSYNSNHLEGNTLSFLDTKVLLLKDIVPNGESYTMRELEEMKAHDVANKIITEWAHDSAHELSEKDIKELNQIILVKDYYKDAVTPSGDDTRKKIKVGSYKEQPNHVRLANEEVFYYADPIEVPAMMDELLQWYRTNRQEIHPIELASILHHRFVLIHPFDDGNGRLSRLLVNYILIRYGYPPLIIKSIEKQKYLNALRRADAGDMNAFIIYMADQVKWSLDICIKAAKGEDINEMGDLDRKMELLKKEQKIESEVSGKYSFENIEQVANRELPFIISEIEKLRLKFDEFYNSSVYTLFLDAQIHTFDHHEETEPTIIKFFKDEKNNNRLPQLLKIRLRFLDPISHNYESKISIEISLQFLHNRVKISIEDKHVELFSYGNKWNEDRVLKCIENMGNDLYDKMHKN